jgi:RNA polymerase-interacting CarD/CdnL/TRCF family regulator
MLNIGQKIRYKKLGPGIVIAQEVRKFSGQDRQFAVIDFPHREMTVQLPIGDPIVAENISQLATVGELRDLLSKLDQPFVLQRNWEQRREQGQQLLSSPDPEGLGQLLATYARAQGAGITISSADRSMIQEAQELLAAELFLLDEGVESWTEGQEKVIDYYQQAVSRYRSQGWVADNFAALAQQIAPDADALAPAEGGQERPLPASWQAQPEA